jgi:hypothetical protein
MDDLNYLRDYVGRTLDKLDLGAVKLNNNTLGYGDYILANCGFSELILPSSLEYLDGWYILGNNINLKTIDLPNSLKNIRPRFLSGCTSLETVTGGENVTEMESGNGMYFDNCPNLKSPVILGNILFRLPLSTIGAYEVPEYVTTIARDGMWNVTGLTAITLPESLTTIYANAFSGNVNLKDIYYYAVELPNVDSPFEGFDRSACTLHVYEEMVDVFNANDQWNAFNIVGDLGTMPVITPMNEADYADLCTIYNTLDGSNWTTKWVVNSNVQTASRWRGVTFDEQGYVTSIDLSNNGLKGNITSLSFTGLTRLTSLNMSSNALSGDIMSFKTNLPTNCRLNVERQELGYVGEHTLYELCNYGGLPSIAYYRSENGTLASTLIGVGGYCQFYHEGTNGGQYWDCYIHADGSTTNNFKFYWPSPAKVECFYPHHFTFTYNYKMGDANMDDNLNVLDLQATLNYSNGQQWGLFNFYAADTYGQDDEINVQDIVSTVNILLAQENYTRSATTRSDADVLTEACVSVENGQIVLYTTKPVAALDLRLAGIAPDLLHWNTEALGFTTVTTSQADGTHAIIYSMQPRQIEEGSTVIATFDANINPVLVSAVLSDNKARSIKVGNSVSTGIRQLNGKVAGNWSLTNLSGLRIAYGINATEAEILKLANDRQLHGVFILDMDGAKHKIMIK